MRLRDKVALVTGGSRGNGRAIALGLAREGADVAISYAQAATAADEVVAETRALGRRGVAVPADTGRRADVERLVARVVEELGRIDILFNNGGVLTRAPFLETSEEAWDRVMDVNLKGYFLVGQAVARTMVERRIAGSIVNVSSVYGQRGAAGVTPYVVSKGGIGMLTKQMALELGPYGIRVNALSPGLIETDMNRDALADPTYRQARLARIPIGKIGTPEDLVGLAVLLASDESALVTGSDFLIDGGVSIT